METQLEGLWPMKWPAKNCFPDLQGVLIFTELMSTSERTRTLSDEDHDRYMARAIALGRTAMQDGDGPAGCVIVKAGQILGEARNCVRTRQDPTAHCEMLAIREVSAKCGTSVLKGSTLYATMEPCPMCGQAILDAGISTLVLGARYAHFKTAEFGDYSIERLVSTQPTPSALTIVTGIREEECQALRYEALERMVRENAVHLHRIASGPDSCPSAQQKEAVFEEKGVRASVKRALRAVAKLWRRRTKS